MGPLGELQMMPRHPFVIPGGDQVVDREHRPPQRGQPGPAGPGEVHRRAGVVRGRRGARRSDHRLDLLDRLGNVKVGAVELCDRPVHHLLQPDPNLLDTFDPAAVLIQPRHGLHRRGAGSDLLRQLTHLGIDPLKLLPAPGVHLLRVDAGPHEPPGAEQIAFPPCRLSSACGGGQVGFTQIALHPHHSCRGAVGRFLQLRLQCVRTLGDEPMEPAGSPGPFRLIGQPGVQLSDDGLHLPRCGGEPQASSLFQRLDQ